MEFRGLEVCRSLTTELEVHEEFLSCNFDSIEWMFIVGAVRQRIGVAIDVLLITHMCHLVLQSP